MELDFFPLLGKYKPGRVVEDKGQPASHEKLNKSFGHLVIVSKMSLSTLHLAVLPTDISWRILLFYKGINPHYIEY